MLRHQTIARITAAIEALPDKRLKDLLGLTEAWTRSSVYATLPNAEKNKIDDAVASLDLGEGIGLETVKAVTDAKLKAAGS